MHNYTIHPQYGSLLSSDFLLAQVLCLLKRLKNSLLVFWTIRCISSTFLTKHPILYLKHFQRYHITGKYWNTVIIRLHQQRRYYRWGQASRDRSPAKELGWNGKGQQRQQLLLVLCAGGGSRCPAHLDINSSVGPGADARVRQEAEEPLGSAGALRSSQGKERRGFLALRSSGQPKACVCEKLTANSKSTLMRLQKMSLIKVPQ